MNRKNNWQDDPQIQEQLRRRTVRNGVLRSAILWTPPFLICFVLLVWFLIDKLSGGDTATWFLVVVLTGFSTLFGIQAYQSIADLLGHSKTVEGLVTRRWTRTDSLVMKSHYIRLDRLILRGDAYSLAGIKQGDHVKIEYYPHSAVIVDLEKLARPDDLPPIEANP